MQFRGTTQFPKANGNRVTFGTCYVDNETISGRHYPSMSENAGVSVQSTHINR
jgi:hypothetical protein